MPLTQSPNSEAQPSDIYEWTEGRGLVATEERSEPVTLANGRTYEPSQLTSAYIFPGG